MTNNSLPRILCVDDDRINLKVIEIYADEYDCSYVGVLSGKDAIAEFKKARYDLVFLDIGLQGMSGIDVAKEMRQIDMESNRHTPIIAYTARQMDDLKEYSHLFDDYLIKPAFGKDISEMLKKHHLKEGQGDSGLHRKDKI